MLLQDKILIESINKQEKRLIDSCPDGLKKLVEDPALLEKFQQTFTLEKKPFYITRGLCEKDIEALYVTGYNFYTQSKFKESGNIFLIMAFYNHLDRRAWMGIGGSFQQLGKYQIALKGYETASKLEPENPIPYFHSYECHLKLNQNAQALKELEKASIISEHYSQYREIYKEIEKIKEKLNLYKEV